MDRWIIYVIAAMGMTGGFILGVGQGPSEADIARRVQQARTETLRNCTSDDDREFKKGHFRNSRGQGF